MNIIHSCKVDYSKVREISDYQQWILFSGNT